MVFPFLPGDSLLFVAGTVVATAGLNVHLLVVAAVRRRDRSATRSTTRSAATSARRSSSDRDSRWLKQEHLRRTQRVLRALRRRHDHHRRASCRSSARSRRSSPASAAMTLSRASWRTTSIGGVAVDRLARLRRLFLRQHPVGQGQPVASSSSAIVVVSLIPAVVHVPARAARSDGSADRSRDRRRLDRACASSAALPM